MHYSSTFLTRIARVADRLEIERSYVDAKNGRLLKLSRDGRSCLFGAAPLQMWPFNSAMSSAISRDKELSLRLVSQHGVGVPKSEIGVVDLSPYAHLDRPPPQVMEVLATDEFSYPLVIKPNDSRAGRGVAIVHDRSDVRQAVDAAATQSNTLVVQEFVAGEETRVFSLGGRALLAIDRKPLGLIGDGRSTIRDLLQADASFARLRRDNDSAAISIDSFLASRGDERPAAGCEVFPYPIASLHARGGTSEVGDAETRAWDELCQSVRDAIGAEFLAIDVRRRAADERPLVLEVNSNPGTDAIFSVSEEVGDRFLAAVIESAM